MFLNLIYLFNLINIIYIGGLDADMRDWGMISEGNSKKKVMSKEEKALSEFKAWDSNKQLLGKKKSNKSFKSKSKHKRR